MNDFLRERFENIPNSDKNGLEVNKASKPIREDTLNYRGDSLFAAYQALWTASNEYYIGLVPNNDIVKHAFHALSTFSFKAIVEIMNDHLRSQVSQQLHLMYLPYTLKQWKAISNLLTAYPYTPEQKTKLSDITKLSESLAIALKKTKPEHLTGSLIDSVKHYVNRLSEVIYEVPSDYLWIVANKATLVLLDAKRYLEKENTLNTILQYLDKYRNERPHDNRTFEQRFSDDVSTCLMYNYPHPEQYLALQRAKLILSMYFTPSQIAREFIDNVEYKINRYLSEVEYRLGLDLIRSVEENVYGEKEKVADKPTPLSDRSSQEIYKYYQKFLKALNHYQLTGKGIKDVLELSNELRTLPYDKVYTIAGFADNMALVDGLKLFN